MAHHPDADFHRFAGEQLDRTEMLGYARKTYAAMAEFWPSPAGVEADPETAVRMNRLPKVVCSHTLEAAT